MTRLSYTSIASLALALVFGLFLLSSTATAQPSPTINYQGKLTTPAGVAVPDGEYNMRFWLLTSEGVATTSAEWTESLTGSDQVQVTNGLFSVMLGSTSPLTSVDFNQTLYLGVEIGGTGSPAWDGELSPRKILGTVPAAFEASRVGGVASSSFLRSDVDDTASGLLNFTSGFISSASSSINNLNFGTATGTNLVINGESFSDFTGLGLVNDAGSLSVSTTSLNLVTSLQDLSDVAAITETLGDLLYWNGNEWADLATSSLNVALGDTTGTLGVTRGGTGLTSVATGDLIYGSGANTISALTAGADGQILQLSGGLPSWAATSSLGITSSPWTISGSDISYTSGSVTGSTFMTSGGLALGAGMTREGVWNNSIASLSGLYGMTSDQTNIREIVPETIFASAYSIDVVSTPLQNGNVFISYRDVDNSNRGTFVIYDPAGNEVVGPTVFESGTTQFIDTTTLQNGNVFISYQDNGNSQYGTFVIYDPAGNEVVAPTVFESADTREISATPLPNGNVLVSYQDGGNSFYGTFVIYDSSGNQVAGSTVFESAAVGDISAVTLQDGNIFIGYRDQGNSNYGTFVIYDAAGNEVVAPTVFESAIIDHTSVTTLQNGNVLISYADDGNSSYGTFVIYDPAGNEVVAPTVFENSEVYDSPSVALPNGNVLISYNDVGNGDYPTFVIYDQAGNEVVGPTVFKSDRSYNISATLLKNGNVFIGYRDWGNGSYGTFVIYGGSGTTFTDRLAVDTNTEVGYDLFNITGSTTATTTAITQLGSGDVFTLNNSVGRILTVNNAGNVGIGTSSPSSKLTVAGNTWLDSNIINLASSSASSLVLNYNTAATSTILNNSAYAFTIATSTDVAPVFRIDTSGSSANTSIAGGFDVNNGAISYNASNNLTSIQNLQLGNLNFADDSGVVSWVDMGVTGASSVGTPMSYSAAIDGNDLLTLYALADGSGGITDSAVGIGTSSPFARLTIDGDLALSRHIYDSTYATGTAGYILQTTNTGTEWVATSSLGIGGGITSVSSSTLAAGNWQNGYLLQASTTATSGYEWVATSSLGIGGGGGVTAFTGLTDTQGSLTANRLIFTNGAGDSLTDSSNLTFDGTDFGLGASNGIAFGGTRYLYASSTNDSVSFGENAGATFNSGTTYNVAIGYEAGRYASTSGSIYNNFIGWRAGLNNTGDGNNIFGQEAGLNNSSYSNNIFGNYAGYGNTGSLNNLFGSGAGRYNSGDRNNIFGSDAGENNTGSYNNIFGGTAGIKNIGDYNEIFGYQAGYNLQATSSIVIGSEALRGGSGSTAFQAINNTAIGYRAGYNAQTGSDGNILLGYRAADNLTTGANNIVIGYDVDLQDATADNTLNIGNLIFGTGIDGTGTSLSSGNIGIGTSSPSSKLDIWGDLRVGTSSTNLFSVNSSNETVSIGDIASSSNILSVQGSNDNQSVFLAGSGGYGASFFLEGVNTGIGSYGGDVRLLSGGGFQEQAGNVLIESGDGTGTGSEDGQIILRSYSQPGTFAPDSGGIVMNGDTGSPVMIGTSTRYFTRLSVQSFGTNDILNLFETDGEEVFTVLESGDVGIGSSSPSSKLTVTGNTYIDGDFTLTGAFNDSTNSSGTDGMVLQTIGIGTQWVATSSLGFSTVASLEDLTDVSSMTEDFGDLLYWNGSAWADIATSSLGLGDGSFLGLSDTPGSYTSNAIPYVSGSSLNFDSNFTYDGSNLGIGTASPGAMLDIFGVSNSLRLSYDGSTYNEFFTNSAGELVINSTGGTDSSIVLGSGSAEDLLFGFDGSATDYYFGVDDSTDEFTFGTGLTMGANAVLSITDATTTINNAFVSSSTATSTFANGIELEGGCFRDASGSCIKTAGDTVVTVAANDTPANEKAYVDYVADGTNDEVTIQSAIDYAHNSGAGGKVHLLSGTFNVSNQINLATSTALVGQGSSTVLRLADSSPDSISILSANYAHYTYVGYLNLQGNRSNNTNDNQNGISLLNTASSSIEHITANDFQDHGVYLDGATGNKVSFSTASGNEDQGFSMNSNSNNNVLTGNIAATNDTHGFYVLSSDNNIFTGNNAQNNGIQGFYLQSGSTNSFTSNLAYNNGAHGFHVYLSSNNILADNTASENNSRGLNLGFSSNVTLQGNHLHNNGGGGASNYSIYVHGDDNNIINNTIQATGTAPLIYLSSGNERTIVLGNVFTNDELEDSTFVSDNGTGTRYDQWNRQTLLTTNSVDYNLLNITGSTTATATAITQLGSGDVFTLNNAVSRVLTVDNGGYFGIGTSTPSALLTIGSSTPDSLSSSELYNSAFVGGSLEVDGTSYASTFMTSGGVAMGAGMAREGVWNNSIASLSGLYGMTSDQTNIREIVPATVFESAATDEISATYMENGNVFIAYQDEGNTNYGTFVIYDPAGNEVVAPTVFESADTQYISATTLTNGNVLIGYYGGSGGSLVIYDPAGNEVVGPTVFKSIGLALTINPTTLPNGNIFITYNGGTNGPGIFAIYDPAGNEVVGPTVFEDPVTYINAATTLQNGNVIINYYNIANSYGTFVIYDAAGNEVVAPTVFNSANTYDSDITTLQNGNVIISYQDGGNSNYGTFVIYDPAGNEVVAPTVFESANTSDISATALPNGNVLISYSDVGNSNHGTFVIYDSAGNEVVSPTVFEAADTGNISASTLQNGDIVITYDDNGNSSHGTFVIYGGSGTTFTDRLAVETEDEVGYDLLNITGSTTATATAITQLGSGDIFTLNNSAGRMLTVNNDGNVGLGTTSPSAKLSIESLGFNGTGTVGFDQYLVTENSSDGATQLGNQFFLNASNTATTTLVGGLYRIKDDTEFGNTVRGLEVQTNRGVNTAGENTALSGFARTFGVRGVTTGDAGSDFEPAGGYFETEGTFQGNAIRGYSDSITTATLLSLFQDTSDFQGTGLEMNFGNTTGDFSSTSSKYLDFQNAGTSVFTVSAYGTTTIGDGVNQAGLQIGLGGICVDNDGDCTASTTGRITAVESHLGNSDLAEMYFSSTELEPGEVVTLAGGLSVDRATPDSTDPVIGVVSTKPGLTIGADDTSLNEDEKGYPIALSGRVPVRLSNENGPIKKGDELMLSSLPGVAMKASGTGMVVGIAMEDFDESKKYSETFVNQFGDDLVDPIYEPVKTNTDPRINDGCYYSGGSATGDEVCTPLNATSSVGQIEETNNLMEQESVAEQLAELASEASEEYELDNGEQVKVGSVVMFVNLSKRWLDDSQLASLGALTSTSSLDELGENENETMFDRLLALANSFIDGVLSIFELKADRIEVADEICLDGVCIDSDQLRNLLEADQGGTAPTSGDESSTPTGDDEGGDGTDGDQSGTDTGSETPTDDGGGEVSDTNGSSTLDTNDDEVVDDGSSSTTTDEGNDDSETSTSNDESTDESKSDSTATGDDSNDTETQDAGSDNETNEGDEEEMSDETEGESGDETNDVAEDGSTNDSSDSDPVSDNDEAESDDGTNN